MPDALAAGRSVRCARCAVQWTPVPVPPPPEPAPLPPEPLPPPEPAPSPEPEPALFATRQPLVSPDPVPAPGRPWPLIAAWAASIVALVGMAAALIVFRGDVMDAWPPSTRLFSALGLVS